MRDITLLLANEKVCFDLLLQKPGVNLDNVDLPKSALPVSFSPKRVTFLIQKLHFFTAVVT